ncbi:MAG: epoxyqueuosine reductase [Deferrisomatales bacterium]
MTAAPNLAEFIRDLIADRVARAQARTPFRRPLVGFADAADPLWPRLRELAEPTHRLPADLLPGARTVVAFFVPFGEAVVAANREAEGTAPEWAAAYRETNDLINRLARELTSALAERGVGAAAQPSTHNWDPATLVSGWSHKSAAAIAGLGTFGLHRMLITDLGSAGRFGSVVIDAAVEPTPRPEGERCLYFARGTCGACARACPVGALATAPAGAPNLDKFRCYGQLLRVEAELGADACGKCAVGPCALGVPGLL